jgi:hypothetical protein
MSNKRAVVLDTDDEEQHSNAISASITIILLGAGRHWTDNSTAG